MKARPILFTLAIILFVVSLSVWQYSPVPEEPSVLSFRIGGTFEEVVAASSYPVTRHSNIPTQNYLQAGQTFVTEPAVVLLFSDPDHGFRLPPTKFAMIGYMHNMVHTVATSPMLQRLPFEQAVELLEDLQNQFKAGGWEPWREDGSAWFDLTPDGKKRLYAHLFRNGFSHEATLRVPNKYGMVFRIWCAEGCQSQRPPYLYLIDIGVGDDLYANISSDSEPAPLRSY